MNAAVHAGIYCRLSVEDAATAVESESIQTQKAMLTDYCDRHGYHIADYYIDDGRTGTNFERPGFQRMIGDIESGRINAVICKDLSRFGRNYYEAGMYLGSKAPYGYVKDPADKHHLIVDEEAAAVVRRIFEMAESGAGYNKIARKLHNEGIPNPFTYAVERNPDSLKGRGLEKDTRWHVTSVQKILQNPVYLGMCAQSRMGNKTMHGKQEKKPREEWIIVENTHEALVSAEQWETVQRQIATHRRTRKDGETQMFAGLLYCSDCGSALSFSAVHRKTMPDGGAISDERFAALSAEYEQEYRELERVVAEYETAAAEISDANHRAERFSKLIQEYTSLETLNARILNKLIDHIVVHQREKHEDGSQTQRIEIYYQFIGKVELDINRLLHSQEIA